MRRVGWGNGPWVYVYRSLGLGFGHIIALALEAICLLASTRSNLGGIVYTLVYIQCWKWYGWLS